MWSDLQDAFSWHQRVHHFCKESIATEYLDLFRLRHILRKGILLPIIQRFMDGRKRKRIPDPLFGVMAKLGDVTALDTFFEESLSKLERRMRCARTERIRLDVTERIVSVRKEYARLRNEALINAEKFKY